MQRSLNGEPLTLDTPLDSIDLSARVRGLLDRKGIASLRVALTLDPRALVLEKNFGRGSLAELRALIELAGRAPWESLRAASESADPPAAQPVGAPTQWNALSPWLPPAIADLTLDHVAEIPARMRSFASREALVTVRDLVAIPSSRLVAEPNLGRKSVADTLAAIVALPFERAAPTLTAPVAAKTLADFDSFASLFRAALAPLPQIQRIIVAGRAGTQDPPATLNELGDMLGVSRERIRQLEVKALQTLQLGRWWIDALDAQLQEHTADGIISLDALSQRTPWIATAWENPSVFDFVCDRLLSGRYHRVELDAVDYLARSAQSVLDDRWTSVERALATRAVPFDTSVVERLLDDACGELGGGVRALFFERVRGLWSVHEGRVVSFGDDRGSEVLHWLALQSEPVAVGALAERFGRGRWPDEMVFVERGSVWVRQRLEGFDALVGPASRVCVAHIRAHGRERQWSCAELELVVRRSVGELPRWFGPWPLASLLKASGAVRYLGRGVVVLPEVEGDRVYIREALIETVRDAGGPIALDVLAARARARRSITTLVLATTLRRPPFVRVASGMIGFWDRDVAGSAAHVERANEQVVQWLVSAGVGLSARRALDRLVLVDPLYSRWNTDILRSAFALDERLLTTSAATVGLSEWGDARVPTRKEIIESAFAHAQERVAIDAIIEQIARVHGEAPSRNALSWIAHSYGASREGDWLVLGAREALVECAGLALFPQLSRGVAVELEAWASEESTLDALRSGVDEHSRQLFLDAVVNEAIDLDLTLELQRASHALLDRYDTADDEQRRWIRGAVRYFIESNDASSDFVEGGLEDDRAVLDAVERWLDGDE